MVLAEGCLGEPLAKTAHGLLLHAHRDRVVAIIDSTKAGREAGDVVFGKRMNVPVVASFEEAFDRFRPDTFYVGAATIGGVLPPQFVEAIEGALAKGLTVYNGLHRFLSEEPRFADLAAKHGARIVDVRKPPQDLHVATGAAYDLKVPRVLVMGQDCDIGKRVTVVELVREAQRRGLDAGFVATGQTGCMLSPDAGAVIDRIPADFAAGQVERMVCDVAAMGKDVVFVYGQASIFHPAYSGVSLAILHGAAPNAIVLQNEPGRAQRVLFDNPAYRVAGLRAEIDVIETLGSGRVVAVSLNGKNVKDHGAAAKHASDESGLPAADPLQPGGAAALLDAVLEHLRAKGLMRTSLVPA